MEMYNQRCQCKRFTVIQPKTKKGQLDFTDNRPQNISHCVMGKSIQREVPTDPLQEPHPIAETGSYNARNNETPYNSGQHPRKLFSFGSKTRDEVLGRPEFCPKKIGNRVVAVIDPNGQSVNVEGVQLDHSTSWDSISQTMNRHNELVQRGEIDTCYTLYEARMYYNDQKNLHPVLAGLNASAGSVGVAINIYQNPNIANYIGELQTSWMNFQNFIASGIIESGGKAENEIIGKLIEIKQHLDAMIDVNIDGDE